MANIAADSNPAVKRRNLLLTWFLWPLITLGIYHFVWYYKIHREMRDFTRTPDAPVAGPVLVILLLGWTMIGPLISFFRTGERIRRAQQMATGEGSCNPWIGLLLCFVFGLHVVYYQHELNKLAVE